MKPLWPELFAADLSNAEFPAGVWTIADGVLTASEDQAIWTARDYENFTLDLEFQTAPGANSGGGVDDGRPPHVSLEEPGERPEAAGGRNK